MGPQHQIITWFAINKHGKSKCPKISLEPLNLLFVSIDETNSSMCLKIKNEHARETKLLLYFSPMELFMNSLRWMNSQMELTLHAFLL